MKSDPAVISGILEAGDPEQLYTLLPAMLWVDRVAHHRLPGNICIDAALTLYHLYKVLGLDAEILPVELTVERQGGQRTQYGSLRPHFTDTRFVGHCIVHVPGSRRFIDATAAQFPEVARLGFGPVVGVSDGQPLDGRRVGVQREDSLLVYSVAGGAYRNVIAEGPMVDDQTRPLAIEESMNVLGYLVGLIGKTPEYQAKGRAANLPRLTELIDLTDGANYNGGDTFEFPAGEKLSLSEHLTALA